MTDKKTVEGAMEVALLMIESVDMEQAIQASDNLRRYLRALEAEKDADLKRLNDLWLHSVARIAEKDAEIAAKATRTVELEAGLFAIAPHVVEGLHEDTRLRARIAELESGQVELKKLLAAEITDRRAAESALAAQGAGEPRAYLVYFPTEQRQEFCEELDELTDDITNLPHEIEKLYVGRPPAPEQAEAVRKDAERYRWLRHWHEHVYAVDADGDLILKHHGVGIAGESAERFDAAIDAALAAGEQG